MSRVGTFLRTSWAKEPVVCFSIVIGTVGIALPLFVPKLWGKYPDAQLEDERRAAAHARRQDALKRADYLQ